jgi:heat shock protein HslJ
LLAVALAACSAPGGSPADAGAAPMADNSRNALDWPGVYTGTLPCADCEGIRTRIELRGDGSFSRSLVYLGRSARSLDDAGSFAWDEAGARVTLGAGGRDPQQYQVGENVLFHLDREGRRIGGDLAAAYRLDKIVADPRIEGRRWRLLELNGQAVDTPAARAGAYLELDAARSRASGNASCNRFDGRYELYAGGRLRLGPELAVTRMACPEPERETAFLEALARADGYAIENGILALHRARMAPLARFVDSSEGSR